MTAGPARQARRRPRRAGRRTTSAGRNHLARPADAYESLGQLAVAAARLSQALAQILAFLAAEQAAGRIVIVAGHHPGDPVATLAGAPPARVLPDVQDERGGVTEREHLGTGIPGVPAGGDARSVAGTLTVAVRFAVDDAGGSW